MRRPTERPITHENSLFIGRLPCRLTPLARPSSLAVTLRASGARASGAVGAASRRSPRSRGAGAAVAGRLRRRDDAASNSRSASAGRVAARQRRRGAGGEGRVDLLHVHRAEQGRPALKAAAAGRACGAAGARARAVARRVPARARCPRCCSPRFPARASGTPPAPSLAARPAGAGDDAARPARIPARGRRPGLDRHQAHDARAQPGPPGAVRELPARARWRCRREPRRGCWRRSTAASSCRLARRFRPATAAPTRRCRTDRRTFVGYARRHASTSSTGGTAPTSRRTSRSRARTCR